MHKPFRIVKLYKLHLVSRASRAWKQQRNTDKENLNKNLTLNIGSSRFHMVLLLTVIFQKTPLIESNKTTSQGRKSIPITISRPCNSFGNGPYYSFIISRKILLLLPSSKITHSKHTFIEQSELRWL